MKTLTEYVNHVGHEANASDQAAAIPAAEAWIAHWAELLRESPMSAVGPLASAFADVQRFERDRMSVGHTNRKDPK